MIRDHVWRPIPANDARPAKGPALARPCAYMNCRELRRKHKRSVSVTRMESQ